MNPCPNARPLGQYKTGSSVGRCKLDSIGRMIERPSNWLIYIACAITILMMFHIVADVLMKYCFNSPLDGTIETVAGYYMVAVVFLPFAYVCYTEGQIIVELYTRGLTPRNQLLLDGLLGIGTFVYMAIFTWKTIEEAIFRTAQLEIWETGTTEIPIWPSRWTIALGCGVMTAYVLYKLIRDLRGRNQ